MITITSKVIRIISIILLLTFVVNIAQAQRQKTQRKKKNSVNEINEKLFFPSIQINLNGGKLPDKESNGIRYINFPINYF